MKKKGFRYFVSIQDIRNYQKLSAEEKLNWLEQANQFTSKALDRRTRKIWEQFRSGTI